MLVIICVMVLVICCFQVPSSSDTFRFLLLPFVCFSSPHLCPISSSLAVYLGLCPFNYSPSIHLFCNASQSSVFCVLHVPARYPSAFLVCAFILFFLYFYSSLRLVLPLPAPLCLCCLSLPAVCSRLCILYFTVLFQ